MPTILEAPSVVILASFDQFQVQLFHGLTHFTKITSPVVVPLRLRRAGSSSHISKFAFTPRINTSSCAVSCTSVLLSSANEKNSYSFVFCSRWAYELPPISSIRQAIVLADRLTVLNTSFFSGHTSSTTAFIHFLTNSPPVKGLPLLAIS